ncbi:MAG: L,D-transpeptidase, partial [Candidatus Moraniibacteriota bacterium]
VRVVPEEKVQLKFNDEKRKLVIAPDKNWQPGKKYTIYLPSGKSAMFTEIAENQLDFTVAVVPQVESVIPENQAKDVVIGAEDPIVVNFNKSTKGYFIKFLLNPESDIVYQNNLEKTQFKLLPKDRIQDGIKYDLKIYAKLVDADDADYQNIYEGSFETKPMVPVIWEKDFQLRLSQAEKYTRAKISIGKYIDVNLGTQIMSTFEDGRLLNVNLISSGKRGMDTPIGDHKIYNKSPRAYSKAYGLYMPYWMAIVPDGKFGIHELPEWPGGYKEGTNHLGIPVSHGCVRLGVGAAQTVYDWAEIGTPVIIYRD